MAAASIHCADATRTVSTFVRQWRGTGHSRTLGGGNLGLAAAILRPTRASHGALGVLTIFAAHAGSTSNDAVVCTKTNKQTEKERSKREVKEKEREKKERREKKVSGISGPVHHKQQQTTNRAFAKYLNIKISHLHKLALNNRAPWCSCCQHYIRCGHSVPFLRRT